MPRTRVYEVGERYGRLTVIERRDLPNSRVLCACDCGNKKYIAANMLSYKTRSCGCLKIERIARLKLSHGMSGTKIYWIWSDMVQRCRCSTHPRFYNYGGRGISVCARWLSFENFYADMGERPDKLSLDRRNNNGNYEPGNCRWATLSEQARNKRRYGWENRKPAEPLKGEDNPRARLKNEQAREIRIKNKGLKVLRQELAVEYSVSKSTINKILQGKTYAE